MRYYARIIGMYVLALELFFLLLLAFSFAIFPIAYDGQTPFAGVSVPKYEAYGFLLLVLICGKFNLILMYLLSNGMHHEKKM